MNAMHDTLHPSGGPPDATRPPRHVAIVTAGGAGMFCGSCMHDNTLARALIRRGVEVSLVPTYTPIRVDESDVSQHQVLLGGVNVYLDARVPLWSHLPRFLTRWLDAPGFLRLVTRFFVDSNAKNLGDLTVALLKGEAGPERQEVDEFALALGRQLRPDIICFSNALLAGTLRRLKEEFAGPVYCLLQGDDIFIRDLPEPHRSQVLSLLREHTRQFDGFLVHSAYYRDFMSAYLQIPLEKLHIVPLGIDLAGHDGEPRPAPSDPFKIGYFARICPEKGLHQLISAFRLLHAKHPRTRLVAGGYLGARDKAWFRRVSRDAADLGAAFEYIGSPAGHAEKVSFLKSLDLLSVPTEYHEPKGLYVLEALANGVPVVQPRHGAFPELIAATSGGLLANPLDAVDLAARLEELLLNPRLRFELAQSGRTQVRSRFDPDTMADATMRVFEQGMATRKN